MASMSAITATGFSRNRKSIPTRLLIKSGPVRRLLFNEFPLKTDAALETRRTLPGLLGFVTG